MVLRRMFLALTVALTLAGTVAGTASAEESAQADRQLLFYNHASGVVDRETADAVAESVYLRKFADLVVRTTTGAGGVSWTGRYLMGRETYLELFGVGDQAGQAGTLGTTALGVSTEYDGDLATVAERLKAQGIANPIEVMQSRDFGDGVPVPWFDATLVTQQYDSFVSWAMEYRPEYFADPRGGTEPPDHPGDVGRERYLPDGYRDRMMRDITGVRLAVTQGDLAGTVPLLRAGGFVIQPAPGGGVVALRGGTTICLEVAPRARAGLRQVEFSLNEPVVYRHEERIGRSTLVVGPGLRAVWTFDA
jgi:hypothetical protein